MSGSVIALAGTAEKGYLDTQLTVSTPGGHSSIPPPHTGIGILSRLLVEYEDNPIEAHLERGTPIYSIVQRVGEHAKDFPSDLRALIEASAYSDLALQQLEAVLTTDNTLRALIGTTQAIDLVQGGVKANALLEEAWAVVNHRIATQSSVTAVQQRDTDVLKDLANEFNFSFTAFGSVIFPEDESTILGHNQRYKALLEAHSPHRPLWSLRRGDHSFPGRTWDPHSQGTYTATIFFFKSELRLLIA